MKKIITTMLLLSCFLCSCGCNNSSSTSQNDGTTSIQLTKENIPTYFYVTMAGTQGAFRTNFSIMFSGVLSFAVYENVKVGLNLHIYAQDGSPYYKAMNDNFSRELILNAAGVGSSTLYFSDGTIDHIIDTTLGYDMLAHYQITWSIKSISGSVTYKI